MRLSCNKLQNPQLSRSTDKSCRKIHVFTVAARLEWVDTHHMLLQEETEDSQPSTPLLSSEGLVTIVTRIEGQQWRRQGL